jgi:ABC-type antimicrobial peptide transport system permease subunit
VIAALTLSLVTGIVFGLLPARRAAKLDPVAALAGK